MSKKIKLSSIKPNPNNPRLIKDERFKKLVQSIEEFPKMFKMRPIVIDENRVILGGNMRYKALLHLKFKEVPNEWIKLESDLTDEEKKEFIIKDNVGYGEHDFDMLANEWDTDDLEAWGVELPINTQIDQLDEGEEIEIPQSVQLEPPREYILIMADPNSVEWEEMKQDLKLQIVRKGGYKKGSAFDNVGLERVIEWKDFKKRIDANSDTKQKQSRENGNR